MKTVQKSFTLIITLITMFAIPTALALPQGAKVVQGAAIFNQPQSGTLNITNSDKTIINWQQFNIGPGQTTNFIQPDSSSAVLNRVISNNPSEILGQLNSNGQVYLINQHGILVGEGAQINTQSFFASTLNISDDDFNNNVLSFSSGGHGKITNRGYIKTAENGHIVLIAPNIENGGVIEVDNGNIILAAGQSITITDLSNSQLIFKIKSPDNSITNLGSALANKGAVSLFTGSLTHTGTIKATGMVRDSNGIIRLVAIDKNNVSGSLDVSGDKGGVIDVMGDKISIETGALINASGIHQGGQILIGGNKQGLNLEYPNATTSIIDSGSKIQADAIQNGNGGKVIVFSENDVHIHGEITAKGGTLSGNGGFIETSGLQVLDISAIPDASAVNGQAGEWLIDPNNIEIIAGSSFTGINDTTPFSSANDSAKLGADLITASLNAGTSVTISTGAGGLESGDININAVISSTVSQADITLTLNAHNDININADITDSLSGFDLVLNPDSDTSGLGQVNFFTSILGINDITLNGPSFISGDLIINGSGNINLTNTMTLNDTFNLSINNDRNISGTFLQVAGTLTNEANLSIENYTWQGGNLKGAGTTTVTNNLLLNGSADNALIFEQTLISNNNTLRDSDSLGFYFFDSAHFINNGTFLDLTIHTIGALSDNNSTFTNTGSYTYNNSFNSKGFKFQVINSGTIEILNGTLNIIDKDDAVLDLDLGTGTLSGIGAINTNIIASAGSSITPNVATGALTIEGDLTFKDSSNLIIGLESTTNFAQLSVTGNIQIDAGATLEISETNGYVGVVNDAFNDVLLASSITGTFDAVNARLFSLSAVYTASLSLTVQDLNNLWTGASNNGLWIDAGNWTQGTPSTGDSIIIDDGSSTVTAASVNETFNTLITSSGTTLNLDSSIFTLNASSNIAGTLDLSQSSITSSGDMAIQALSLDNSNLIGSNTALNIFDPLIMNNASAIENWSPVTTSSILINGAAQFNNVNIAHTDNISITDANDSLTLNNSVLTSVSGSSFSGNGSLDIDNASNWILNSPITLPQSMTLNIINGDISNIGDLTFPATVNASTALFNSGDIITIPTGTTLNYLSSSDINTTQDITNNGVLNLQPSSSSITLASSNSSRLINNGDLIIAQNTNITSQLDIDNFGDLNVNPNSTLLIDSTSTLLMDSPSVTALSGSGTLSIPGTLTVNQDVIIPDTLNFILSGNLILQNTASFNITDSTFTLNSLSTSSGSTLNLDSSILTLNSDSTIAGTLNLNQSSITSLGDMNIQTMNLDNSNLMGSNTALTIVDPLIMDNASAIENWSPVTTSSILINGAAQFNNVNIAHTDNITITDANDSLTLNNSVLTSDSGSSFSGNGSLDIDNASNWILNSPITLPQSMTLNITDGDISNISDLTFPATVNASTALFNSGDIITIPTSTTLNYLSSSDINTSQNITNNGVLNLQPSSSVIALTSSNSSRLINNGDFIITQNTSITSQLDIDNFGDLNVNPNSTLLIDSTSTLLMDSPSITALSGSGSLSISGQMIINKDITLPDTMIYQLEGDLIMQSDANFDIGNTTLTLNSSSKLLGSGSITGNVVNIAGTLNPGSDTELGGLTIVGDYTQGSDAVTIIEISNNGSNSTTYDTLNVVSGVTTLDGELQLSNLGSSSFISSSPFSPLNFGTTAGKFTSITDGSNTIQSDFSNGTLTIFGSELNFNNLLIQSPAHENDQINELTDEVTSDQNILSRSANDNTLNDLILTAENNDNIFVCR